MNGTSEPRWRRKRASVASSLSPTRSRKRPAASGGAGTRAGGLGAKADVYGSERLDGVEGDHLGELAALEAVDFAALEVPPGDLVVIGVVDVLDLVGMAHVVV